MENAARTVFDAIHARSSEGKLGHEALKEALVDALDGGEGIGRQLWAVGHVVSFDSFECGDS